MMTKPLLKNNRDKYDRLIEHLKCTKNYGDVRVCGLYCGLRGTLPKRTCDFLSETFGLTRVGLFRLLGCYNEPDGEHLRKGH